MAIWNERLNSSPFKAPGPENGPSTPSLNTLLGALAAAGCSAAVGAAACGAAACGAAACGTAVGAAVGCAGAAQAVSTSGATMTSTASTANRLNCFFICVL